MCLLPELDELSLYEAVQQHFGGIDLMPWSFPFGGLPDGVADLDPTRVIYEGTSMGGFLGASFVALTPELDGGFLQVPGSGIIDTLYHSLIWPLFTGVVPSGASPGDTQALVGAVGMLLDFGEVGRNAARAPSPGGRTPRGAHVAFRSAAARARSSSFTTLPAALIGSSATATTCRGTL